MIYPIILFVKFSDPLGVAVMELPENEIEVAKRTDTTTSSENEDTEDSNIKEETNLGVSESEESDSKLDKPQEEEVSTEEVGSDDVSTVEASNLLIDFWKLTSYLNVLIKILLIVNRNMYIEEEACAASSLGHRVLSIIVVPRVIPVA